MDCSAGAEASAILAACIDLGADPAQLTRDLEALQLPGIMISPASVPESSDRSLPPGGMQVHFGGPTSFPVPPPQTWREWVQRIDLAPEAAQAVLEAADGLLRWAADNARGGSDSWDCLAGFGGFETLVATVGTAIALWQLGVAHLYASALPLAAPGSADAPADRMYRLLVGLPVFGLPAGGGTSPGAALLLRVLAKDRFGSWPSMTLDAVGHGLMRGKGGRLQRVRMALGTCTEPPTPFACAPAGQDTLGDYAADHLLLLETNIDDMSPELLAYVQPLLLDQGALDVWVTPILMKKGRAAHTLSVLVEPPNASGVVDTILAQTSTFGIRTLPTRRIRLERRFEQVEVFGRPVRVKVGFRGGEAVTRSPEFEDCRAAAEAAGVPLKDVYEAVRRKLPPILPTPH